MQTQTFVEALKDVMRQFGLATDIASLPSLDVAPYNLWARFMEKRCREAYQQAFWNGMLVTEERTCDADGRIDFDQDGEIRIGTPVPQWAVTAYDPRQTDTPRPVPYVVDSGAIQLLKVTEATTVWVSYRRAPPRFSTVYFQGPPNVYQKGTVVLWPTTGEEETEQLWGNCYELRQQANGTAYWDLQIIPTEMSGWLLESVFADALMNNGQRERALQHLNDVAYPELFRAVKENTSVLGQRNVARAGVN